MPKSPPTLNVFIGCPGDMAPERAALLELRDHLDHLGIPVRFLIWKHATPGAGDAQRVIFDNYPIADWDLFIGLLWKRFGEPSGYRDPISGEMLTGTEAEFVGAYDAWRASGGKRPHILLYRCRRALPDDVDLEQLAGVRKFFKQTETGGDRPALAQDFRIAEDLCRMIVPHLKKAAERLHGFGSDAAGTAPRAARSSSPTTPAHDSGTLLQRYFAHLRAQFSIHDNVGLPVHARDRADEEDSRIPIRALFVAPRCSAEHLPPAALDAAMRKGESLGEHLLPHLAVAKSRTVLLADPGMGKSTVIQWLIATLADEKPPEGAPALRGAIPFPFILRELAALLPADVGKWNWDTLLDAFRRWHPAGASLPPLAAPLTGDEALLRSLLGSERAFFLIDGLDEIGDAPRRLAIRDALWEGFERYPEARWLITSRIVGYEQAMVERKPPPFIGDTTRDAYASAQAAAVIAARSARTGDKFPDSILEKVMGLPGITVDPTSFEKDGGDVIFAFETEDTSGETRKIWARGGAHGIKFAAIKPESTESSNIDLTAAAIREPKKAEAGRGGYDKPTEKGGMAGATRLHLAPFDDTQQLAFAERWYIPRMGATLGRQRAAEFIAAVHAHEHTRVIGRVPNLLYLLALLFRHEAHLPNGRALVYEAISSAYLDTIAARRGLHDATSFAHSFARKEELLAIVGLEMQEQRGGAGEDGEGREVLVTRTQLEEWLGPHFGGAIDPAACAQLDAFLDHIARRSGLLLPRGEGVFGFAHLSFQEYYAACHLQKDFERILDARQNSGRGIFAPAAPTAAPGEEQIFARLAAQPAWHEPLLFLAEKLRKSPPFTLRLIEWMFPQLGTEPMGKKDEVEAWMPFPAARLLAAISLDPEAALDDAQRTTIWRVLWKAHLAAWSTGWNIAPWLLVAGSDCHAAVLRAAADLQPERFHLFECTALSDLKPLRGFDALRMLTLTGCTAVSDLEPLRGLGALKELSLRDCTAANAEAVAELRRARPELYISGP